MQLQIVAPLASRVGWLSTVSHLWLMSMWILLDGSPQVHADFGGWFKRVVNVPPSEQMVRGPSVRQQVNIQDEYQAINIALVNHVRSRDAFENLLVALNWLKISLGEAEPMEGVPVFKKEPLIKFTSLLNVLQCNNVAYESLLENEQASGQRLMVPRDQLGPLRRIDQVIRSMVEQHAEQCMFEYPRLFREVREGADGDELKAVKRMMKRIIETNRRRIFASSNRLVDERTMLAERARDFESVKGDVEAAALLKYLREVTNDNEEELSCLEVRSDERVRNRWTVDEDRVRQLAQKYAYGKCEYVLKTFSHVLEPAAYAQQIYKLDQRYKAVNRDNAELMIWLEYFRLCKRMVKTDRKQLTKNLIKAIWNDK